MENWNSDTNIEKGSNQSIPDCRPMSLLNGVYEIWAIIMTNRIAPLLNLLTNELQRAY